MDLNGPDRSQQPKPETAAPAVSGEALSTALPGAIPSHGSAALPPPPEGMVERLERLADTFNLVDACWDPEDHPDLDPARIPNEDEANSMADSAVKELGEIVGREIDMTAEKATFMDYVKACRRLAERYMNEQAGPGNPEILPQQGTADRFYGYLKAMNWIVDDAALASLGMGINSSSQIAGIMDFYQRAKELNDEVIIANFTKRMSECLHTLVFMIDDRTLDAVGCGFTNADVQRDVSRYIVEECARSRTSRTEGDYLPVHLRNMIRQQMDGSGCRAFLEGLGYRVVSNQDMGSHGEAVTACGMVLSTNGYIRRV